MTKMWGVVAIVLVIFPVFCHGTTPVVPCYFVFGDSLSDPGNNNNLKTAAKANYFPYGIDFPGGSTGRFTNGRTFVDALTELLGFQGYITSFKDANGPAITKGVNYASGAAGIRIESGSQLGDRIWLDRQLSNHAITTGKLSSYVQGPVAKYLNKCLYTVNIGSNDYINNYFLPQQYPTKKLFNPDQYAAALVAQYSVQLKALHAAGARKVAVFGLGLIGCAPAQIAKNNAATCVDEINQAVQLFNQKLVPALDNINAKLPGANFTFIDTFSMQAASPPGAFITNSTCCKLRTDFQCEASVKPCDNRNEYAFMDGFHPTEAVNVQAAQAAYTSPSPKFVRPVDISHLVSS